MGVSTDGIFCYGFELNEDFEKPWADFDDWIAEKLGKVQHPRVAFSEATKSEYHVFWEKRKAFVESSPVELVIHCSHEYPAEILAIRGTVVSAYRGYPKAVSIGELQAVAASKLDAFRVALINLHLPVKEPTWLLCSFWG